MIFAQLTTAQYLHLAADLDVPVAGFPYPTQQDMKAGNAIRVLVAEREALQVRLIQQVTLVEQCMVEMNRNADMGEKAEKERDALQAMLDNAESDYRGKCAELELVHDSHDAALAKLAELEKQEPVAYEYRIKPDWLPDWQLWHPCTKPQYDDFIKTPKSHDWHYETRALYAHPKPARTLSDVPTMFWNWHDAEKPHGSIDELLNDEICNGTPLEVGAELTIQRAISLPKIKIRITSIDEEACEAEYEIVEAALKGTP